METKIQLNDYQKKKGEFVKKKNNYKVHNPGGGRQDIKQKYLVSSKKPKK